MKKLLCIYCHPRIPLPSPASATPLGDTKICSRNYTMEILTSSDYVLFQKTIRVKVLLFFFILTQGAAALWDNVKRGPTGRKTKAENWRPKVSSYDSIHSDARTLVRL